MPESRELAADAGGTRRDELRYGERECLGDRSPHPTAFDNDSMSPLTSPPRSGLDRERASLHAPVATLVDADHIAART
jgi:hypothetical protein